MAEIEEHSEHDPEPVPPLDPEGGAPTSNQIKVVNGRKISPSAGKIHVSNTASKYAGRAIQANTTMRCGANAASNTSRQPMGPPPADPGRARPAS